jgi:hypothetical protein
MTSMACWPFRLAYSVATLALVPVVSARADFFDDARRTFQTDIPHFFQTDFPHFFQDDIPCAFGGQPTSHTKTFCKSPENPAKHTADQDRDRAADRPEEAHDLLNAPPRSDR